MWICNTPLSSLFNQSPTLSVVAWRTIWCFKTDTWRWKLLLSKLYVFLLGSICSVLFTSIIVHNHGDDAILYSYICCQEHILETQDKAEADRIMVKIEECKKTLLSLGYIEFTFEDFFAVSLFNGYFRIFPSVIHFLLGWFSNLFALHCLLFVGLSTMCHDRFQMIFWVFAQELAYKLSDVCICRTGLVWVIVVHASCQSFEAHGYADFFVWKIN